MPCWKPEKVWDQQDVFIIGGGASLANFEWSRLKSENTIGCNTAFIQGPEICKVCIFGDFAWWKKFQYDLSKYAEDGGVVFTNTPQLLKSKINWLWTMHREAHGLHTDRLGWNGNTGAVAINLAILFGAKRVYLLGFDMKHVDGRSNWHNKILDPNRVRSSVYIDFCKQFHWLVRDWKSKFPSVEIYNVTKNSDLPSGLIPWIDPDTLFANRK